MRLESRTVELVLARSERQARVVERAMRTGFFIDQLLIPQASYIGRFAWSELDNLTVKRALENARPGEPYLLGSTTGKYLVARVLPTGPPAILGETRYAQKLEDIWVVLSVGLTDAQLLSIEVDVDTEDLTAICRSKTRLADSQLRAARSKVEALHPEAPFPEVIQAHKALIGVHAMRGEMDESIEVLNSLARQVPPAQDGAERYLRDIVNRSLGILELRRGEVENCLHHHHREMCLFPLSEAARHRFGDGARRAVEHYSRYLEKHPDDLEARWLLNIATMTVGSYPKAVPESLRIGPEAFASEVDLGRFWDIAGPAGVSYSDNAGGSVSDDFDGDGLLDLVVSSRDPCEPLRLYLNRGDGTFEDATESAGLGAQLGGLNVTQVDYDNDGRLDLFVMRGGWETAIRNSLLRNRPAPGGGVTFEDITARAGLGGPAHRTHSAAWADYDGDGWLDVFLAHEMSFSQLFRSRGDGTFEDTTSKAGMRFRSLTKGATWGDVDNDGRPDLYISNFGERNLLFVNRGDGRFDEVAVERGVSEPTYSFPAWFWDYDNDGWQDLLVAVFLQSVDEVAREYLGMPLQAEAMRVYRNRGDGSFEDTTAALGLERMIPTMGANFGDLNNDGYLDFYLGTGAPDYSLLVPNRMFLNQQGRRFVDVTTSTGTGHLQKGHGISFADLDNDGDEDIFANMGGAFLGDKYSSALFENPGHGNDWIAIELIGTRSNRSAIGARIRVVLDEKGREGQRVRWVTTGGSFGSSPLMQHIGLGRDAAILRVEIDWPFRAGSTGPERQVFTEVPTNSYLVVTQGIPGFQLSLRPRFVLGSEAAAADTHHPAD
ncbi:MAG: CRTAC1 family protein [Acidobacteriota bacterium]|nr:CRTAC1 family protein [Acidobacteriota bacterium]